MIHAYTGNGKGKTTAAIGLMIRAFGAGRKVGVVFFDKGSETYRHNELVVLDRLGIDYFVTGLERMKPDGSFRFNIIPEDIKEAQHGLKIANEAIDNRKYDLLVLDEALTSYSVGLLTRDDLLSLIRKNPEEIELVLTGRCSNMQLLDSVDLVTNMTKHKHYFDNGTAARPGIEY
jgi:cob(I)alamin adenosyltransferase